MEDVVGRMRPTATTRQNHIVKDTGYLLKQRGLNEFNMTKDRTFLT